MNKYHVKGAVENAVGLTKEALGQILGDEELAIKGKIDQAKGAAHSAAGYARDAASEATRRYQRYINRY